MSGLAFDLATPHGRRLATILAGIAEFECERVRSGKAAAKARGKLKPFSGTYSPSRLESAATIGERRSRSASWRTPGDGLDRCAALWT
jgi:DNA invertase Pin-like site-specific DNA recombinase